ncbi:MAG: hypothetical protein JKX68_09670 [Flavobacteriales bacterium]|nr:hypothetical protein [Flavobacteriales bacterium]
MKNLRNDIKRILKNECLTNEEKIQLKKIFKKFINTRNILSRKSIDFEFKEDQCFGLDSILNKE